MIITDTTNVNTGKRTGVAVKLQCMFELKGVKIPQFTGRQDSPSGDGRRTWG